MLKIFLLKSSSILDTIPFEICEEFPNPARSKSYKLSNFEVSKLMYLLKLNESFNWEKNYLINLPKLMISVGQQILFLSFFLTKGPSLSKKRSKDFGYNLPMKNIKVL